MPYTPDPPFPKEKGNPLRSKDWNQLVNEVQRLDSAKVNNAGNATLQGPLGIGLSNNAIPRAPLHIAGGNWDLSNTEGDLRIGTDTYRLKIGMAWGGQGAGDVRIRAQGGSNCLMLGTGTQDVLAIRNDHVGIGITSNLTDKLTVKGNLKVDGGDLTLQGGYYRRLKIVSDSYWAGIELVARGQGQAGHPHIDFTHGDLDKPNYGVRLYAPNNDRLVVTGGNLGIGVASPSVPLEVSGDIRTNAALISTGARNTTYASFSHRNQGTAGGYALLQHSNGTTYLNAASNRSLYLRINNGTKMQISNTRLTATVPLVINQAQDISIGVRSGPYAHDGIKGSPNLWLDAVNRVIIKSGYTTNAMDVAERFHSDEKIDTGSVVVLNGSGDHIKACTQANDPQAIGIISRQPGFILGIDEEQLPVALCGRIPCKVDADIAPIQVGDLLTTSSTRGHAQKVVDHEAAAGAIIGKALGNLKQGKGEVLVFVMMR